MTFVPPAAAPEVRMKKQVRYGDGIVQDFHPLPRSAPPL